MDSLHLLASFLKLHLRTELQAQGHNATDRLSQSIDVVVEETIMGFEIVGNAVYYAKYVNDGRKIGATRVPLDALIEWIRIRKTTIAGMKERSVAFMYQASIHNKGIKASMFIDKTLSNNSNAIEGRITDAMGEMVNSYIEIMFNELNIKQ